ncbi:zeatin o-xylosyltransferase [Nicotiana attenuata]|uniref:Zeatin o-xylosyltransferase n=1 Tax=Nicotiana attenuata TaxID=49451 RepID=A0A314KHZ2_NICAT|nr:zeatin o-xylosyltransferase [Nicotiana attenuata]
MKESNSIREAPPFSVDYLTAAPNSSALFLIISPSSDAINFLTTFSMVDALTSSSRFSTPSQSGLFPIFPSPENHFLVDHNPLAKQLLALP